MTPDGFNVLETIIVITVVVEEGFVRVFGDCVVMGLRVYLRGDSQIGSVWKWCECEVTVVRSCQVVEVMILIARRELEGHVGIGNLIR